MMSANASSNLHWDVFCKVVDNFGDIGVSWRLSRQLADEHGIHIRLWVDDLALAKRLAGNGHPLIQLQHWHDRADFSQVTGIVVEMFGCGLPGAYQQQMLKQPCVWVNVDYLSAESWVDDFHAQPSPQANGLIRYFFYPGFTSHTGGLLREKSLHDLQANISWQDLQLPPADHKLTVSLFCYVHAPLAALVKSLETASQAVRVLVPEPIAPQLASILNLPRLQAGDVVQHQQCEFLVIPFLSQADYDRLLYLCDINFVRGEDSWIRAIWAGKPMVWLPYQQSENTHLVKLEAFLAQYLARADARVKTSVYNAMQAWAEGTWQEQHWQALLAVLPAIKAHAQRFAEHQSRQVDLATNLVIFIEKCRVHRV